MTLREAKKWIKWRSDQLAAQGVTHAGKRSGIMNDEMSRAGWDTIESGKLYRRMRDQQEREKSA